MSVLTKAELIAMSQIYVAQWCVMSVESEVLLPIGPSGLKWYSKWDNALLPPTDPNDTTTAPGWLEPIVMVDGLALDTDEEVPPYQIEGGSEIRTKVLLATAGTLGPDSPVQASFRRNLFPQSFWENNFQGAAYDIGVRAMMGNLDWMALDTVSSPAGLIIKQAGRNALATVQVMLAGLGKTTQEGMTVDLSRSAAGLSDTLNQLGEEIASGLVTWRHSNSPNGRAVWPRRGLRGPLVQLSWPYGV